MRSVLCLPLSLVLYCSEIKRAKQLMVLLGVLLSVDENEGKRVKNVKKERERWRIPKDATPSDCAAVVDGSGASPNYSRLVTSRGRRWRSSRAATINQRRLACSQGDRRSI